MGDGRSVHIVDRKPTIIGVLFPHLESPTTLIVLAGSLRIVRGFLNNLGNGGIACDFGSLRPVVGPAADAQAGDRHILDGYRGGYRRHIVQRNGAGSGEGITLRSPAGDAGYH